MFLADYRLVVTKGVTKVVCKLNYSSLGYILPPEIRDILIVDGHYALSFWEVLEATDIKGIVVTLSSLNYAQQQASSRAVYNRIRACLNDPAQHCVLFDNEFHEKCFRQALPSESSLNYTTRLNWIAAQWYRQHLKGKVNVILLTENESAALEASKKSGTANDLDDSVLVMNLATYLQTYHPKLTTVWQLYESLSASLKSTTTTNEPAAIVPLRDDVALMSLPQAPSPGDVFPAHLPDAALLAGIRSGQFLRGIIRVSRFRSATEAVVALTDASALKHQAEVKDTEFATRSEIAINGMQYRNRAVDGDVVVVRLLPRQQWSSFSTNLAEAEAGAVETLASSMGSQITAVEALEAGPPTKASMPCGFVVGIMSRNWRDYVCTFVQDESRPAPESAGWVVVTPWDRKIPRIRMFTTRPAQLAKERFIVRIDRWETNSHYPHGHFVQSLGPIGDLETETQTILVEHGLLHRPFTDAQLQELKSYATDRKWKVDPKEVANRRDLRPPSISGNKKSEGTLVFSIDPPGCQDVDDALSVRWLPPNSEGRRRIQLGVHIADVTYFVKAGGNLDAEARRRSTSVYLADRRYDMLPGLLSGDICSLWSGVDRYAMSAIWELDPDSLEVLDVWFGRTVIRSSYKMTYEAAQKIADLKDVGTEETPKPDCILRQLGGKKAVGELVPELANVPDKKLLLSLGELYTAISILARIASSIRARRLERGGLELESIEVSIQFANPETRTGSLQDIIPKEPLEMHSTVAELMIFANHWIARYCLDAFPECSCLRRHPAPRSEFFEELKRCASSKGFSMSVDSNRALATSLEACNDANDPEVNKILRQLATRAMTNALYFSSGAEDLTRDQFGHYGLALNLYTHFTSPIRRYADIVVHRVLMAALQKSAHCGALEVADGQATAATAARSELYEHEELAAICRHMNERHWAAQQAQRASIELFQALFFRDRPADDACRLAEGIICQLRGTNGFSVIVPRYGIRGNVFLRQPDGRVAWASDGTKKGDPTITWLPADSCEILRSTFIPDVSGSSTGGTLPCDQLEVVRSGAHGGKQFYRIFDHVMVYITVSASTAHGLSLRLDLHARVPISAAGGKQPKDGTAAPTMDLKVRADEEMIESVRTLNSERKRKRVGDGGDADAAVAAAKLAMDGEFATEDEIAQQNALIAQLHSASSPYHRFRKILTAAAGGGEDDSVMPDA
ncbi:hypothetical protein AAHC03_019040 [Spirometra sp. Aus1]